MPLGMRMITSSAMPAGGVVAVELGAEAAGLDADDGVGAGIEADAALEDVGAEQVLL